jgi:hypothetical protein
MGKEEQEGLTIFVKGRRSSTGEKLLPFIRIEDKIHENKIGTAMLGAVGLGFLFVIIGASTGLMSMYILAGVILGLCPTFSLLMATRTTSFYPPDHESEELRGMLVRRTRRYWIFGRYREIRVPLHCILSTKVLELENPKLPGRKTHSLSVGGYKRDRN